MRKRGTLFKLLLNILKDGIYFRGYSKAIHNFSHTLQHRCLKIIGQNDAGS